MGRTVTELSELLKLPYSTTYYLLKTMDRHGFVRRDADTKKFYLGAKLMSYQGELSENSDLQIRDVASPYLVQLAGKLGSTAHTAIRQGSEAVYIDRSESPGYLRIKSWIGQHVPLHCTAVGKSLLLLSGPEEIASIFKQDRLNRFTDRTIVRVGDLIKHLGHYRKLGYTVDDRESELEGVCVATPILGAQGKVIAAVGITGPVYQLSVARLPEIGEQLRKAGEEISHQLGFIGECPWSGVIATVT